MKAEIGNRFDIGDLTINLTTALFARKRNGVWRVHLNYHRVEVKYLVTPEQPLPLLSGTGIAIQTSRDNDWISFVSLILGSIGIIKNIVTLIRNVMEILADVSSLIPKTIQWIQEELLGKTEQEPVYQTLQQTAFVLQLMRDGAFIERRLPRWRMKSLSQVHT